MVRCVQAQGVLFEYYELCLFRAHNDEPRAHAQDHGWSGIAGKA